MSVYAMAECWAESKSDGTTLLTLLAIADYAHDDGTLAYPKMADLMKKTRAKSRSTVQRHIKELIKLGELEVEYQPQTSNIYTLVLGKFGDNRRYKEARDRNTAAALVGVEMVDEVAEAIKEYRDIIPKEENGKTRMTRHQEVRVRQFCTDFGPGIVRNAISIAGDSGRWAPDKLREICVEQLELKRRAASSANVTRRSGEMKSFAEIAGGA